MIRRTSRSTQLYIIDSVKNFVTYIIAYKMHFIHFLINNSLLIITKNIIYDNIAFSNFFLDERKFGGSPKKLKCSRCSIIWTSGSNGKPIDVPKLYEPASSQGIKQNTRETKVIDKSWNRVM